MSETRFAVNDKFAMEILKTIDTSKAKVVEMVGQEIIVLFDLSSLEVDALVDVAEQTLFDAGIEPIIDILFGWN